MHNFPNHINVSVANVTEKQAKTILKLCIDNDVDIASETIEDKINKRYPNYHFEFENQEITQNCADSNDNEYHFVSFNEFCNYIKGKGIKIKPPFKQELVLNGSYKAIVTKENVKVGCQEFSHDIIKKLYEASQEALK